MLAIFGTIGTWVLGRLAAWGLGTIGPVLSGVVNTIGSLISAIGEIVASLARSPEGRIVLLLITIVLAGLWLRWHYIGIGEARTQVTINQQVTARVNEVVNARVQAAIAKTRASLQCPVQKKAKS